MVGKPERRRSFGGSRSRSEDKINMDLTEMWFEDVNWVHLTQDRDRCEHSNERLSSMKGRELTSQAYDQLVKKGLCFKALVN